jgi:hypothetical protein
LYAASIAGTNSFGVDAGVFDNPPGRAYHAYDRSTKRPIAVPEQVREIRSYLRDAPCPFLTSIQPYPFTSASPICSNT